MSVCPDCGFPFTESHGDQVCGSGPREIRKARKNETLEIRMFLHDAIKRMPEYPPSVVAMEVNNCSIEQVQTAIYDELCFVVTVNDRIAGVIFGEMDGGMLWVSWIAVDPQYQRRKIATELLRTLLDEVGTTVHKVICATLVSNTASNALLLSEGFQHVVTLKRHWHELDFYQWEKITKEK